MMISATPSHQNEDVCRSKIIELRSLLAEKFPAAVASSQTHTRLATGVEILDRFLDGGLLQAALTEVVSPTHGTGSGTIIHALIAAAYMARKPVALVDASDSFDQDGAAKKELAALLWVRCGDVEQAIHATDLLLRDGNLPLVVLDLAMSDRRQVRGVHSSTWHRLQRIAEDRGTTALVFTPVAIMAGVSHSLQLTRRFELPSLDLHRDELTASLQMETLRARLRPYVADFFEPKVSVLSA